MPTVELITEPRVTLIARPQFIEPPHQPVSWAANDTPTDGERLATFGGRLCYRAFHNPAGKTTAQYFANILGQGHGSVLEHASYSLYVEGVSRALLIELTRHRAGMAYSVLSTRFADESNAAFVIPPAILGDGELEARFAEQCAFALDGYRDLVDQLLERYKDVADTTLRRKLAREAAREVLPHALETQLVVTGNLRAWRAILELRGAPDAAQEIRRWAVAVFRVLEPEAPAVFQDIRVIDTPLGEALTVAHHKV